jgi:hypothetical protein
VPPGHNSIQMLELELVVRDFIGILLTGRDHELAAFLAEEVIFCSRASTRLAGRQAVLDMIREAREIPQRWHIDVTAASVIDAQVVAGLDLLVLSDAGRPHRLRSSDSFDIDGFRIARWDHRASWTRAAHLLQGL